MTSENYDVKQFAVEPQWRHNDAQQFYIAMKCGFKKRQHADSYNLKYYSNKCY
jgi:hypothetical protein